MADEEIRPPDLDEEALAPLAAAILDGNPVDWETISASTSPDQAELVPELRLLERIGIVHRSPDTSDSAAAETEVPSAWAHLQIVEPIGRGTFGRVFRAWDPRLDREVALKLLDAGDVASGSHRSPVIEEARLLARVRHPNVVTVYGAERVGPQVGLWMEYIHGQTLEQMLEQRGVFSAPEVAAIGIDLCAALAAVHSAGLVHRDLKAQNVMREAGGRLVVVDFGAGHEPRGAMNSRMRTGTPVYLAPELFTDAPATAQTEIYSLGVLLFHLLTGSFPVGGRNAAQLREAHGAGRRTLLRDLRPEIDGAFVDIVERAVDPRPGRRFTSAGAFAAALRSWQQREDQAPRPPVDRHPASPLRYSARVWRSSRWAAAGIAVVAATAVLVGIWRLTDSHPNGSTVPERSAAATTTSRRVRMPGYAVLGRPDAQGRHISYMDYDGDLAIADLETGEGRKITEHGDSDETAEFSALSPDGREIVYAWWALDGAYELRAIDVEGRRPRILLPRDAAEYPIPLEWSRDGSQVLCLLLQRDASALVALVPAAGGPPRVIARFAENIPGTISLSGDGRYIAFDRPSSNPAASDVFSLAVDTGVTQLIAGGAADDRSPAWTPDGRGVFFLSDRAGTTDGWIVPVADGAPTHEPQLVARNMARAIPVGFSERGTYLYQLHTGMPDVQVVDVNLTTDSVAGQPRNASSLAGSTIGPDWSRDGRFFSYITTRPTQPLVRGGRAITVQPVMGNPVVLEPSLSMLGVAAPRFSADARTLMVRGRDLRGRSGYFTVDAASGKTATALLIDRPRNLSDYGNFDWSADATALLYIHFPSGLRAKHLVTGRDEVVVSHADAGFSVGGFALSPDARSIAIAGRRTVGRDRRDVIAVSHDGGPPREVLQLESDERIALQTWTHDSRGLIYTTFKPGNPAPHEAWHIAADGGAARPLGLSIDGFTQVNNLTIRPDGRQIAFTRGGAIDYELWTIDHFLP